MHGYKLTESYKCKGERHLIVKQTLRSHAAAADVNSYETTLLERLQAQIHHNGFVFYIIKYIYVLII